MRKDERRRQLGGVFGDEDGPLVRAADQDCATAKPLAGVQQPLHDLGGVAGRPAIVAGRHGPGAEPREVRRRPAPMLGSVYAHAQAAEAAHRTVRSIPAGRGKKQDRRQPTASLAKNVLPQASSLSGRHAANVGDHGSEVYGPGGQGKDLCPIAVPLQPG